MLNQNNLVEGDISYEDIAKKARQNPNRDDTKSPGSPGSDNEYTRGCSHITRCRHDRHNHHE